MNSLEKKLLDENIFKEREKFVEVNKKLTYLKKIKDEFLSLIKLSNNLEDNLLILKDDELDEDIKIEFETEIEKDFWNLNNNVNKMYLNTLLNEKYDNLNALVTLHSGAGGTESYDFVNILFRMYQKFCDDENLKLIVLDFLKEDVGYKSITFKVLGDNAYGLLKSEKGVHRLVRISPFDANKRRHTTFASVEVIPEIENDNEIVINPAELKIDTFRSSGAGGQHVNTTDSAIRITHIPTNIVVTCQNERSQVQNKENALKVLKSKLLNLKISQQKNTISEISGELDKIEWGSQIRSYVFCPYTMVKDHRTNFETSNVEEILDGKLEDFILSYLKYIKNNNE
ncbi:MAG: peptide chain release factor 2 [Clostridiales bacterium]|nr:peptide chain release factor 2 [Clostridiales bacterium]